MNDTLKRTHFKIKKTKTLVYHPHPFENLPRGTVRDFSLARSKFSHLENLSHLVITFGTDKTGTIQARVNR